MLGAHVLARSPSHLIPQLELVRRHEPLRLLAVWRRSNVSDWIICATSPSTAARRTLRSEQSSAQEEGERSYTAGAVAHPLTRIQWMIATLRRLERVLAMFGFSPSVGLATLVALPRFRRQRRAYLAAAGPRPEIPIGRLLPCLGDDGTEAGALHGYFYQDLIVAQKVHTRSPRRHIDVGSRLDGFVANVASFREIEVVDIRPLEVLFPGIKFLRADAMVPGALPRAAADSVSCLHALEHFGLGRYGDPVDPDGHRKGFANLVEMCEPGGIIYLSVPMGPTRVEFNGQRVFSAGYVLALASEHGLEPVGFSYIDDEEVPHVDEPLSPEEVARSFGCMTGCGIFELRKPA